MLAVAVAPGGTLVLAERPDPVAGPGEVLVAVARAGVCGSDLHLLRSGLLPPGAVLGHEMGGTVVAGDPDGAGPPEGSRVAVLPARRCGVCPACRGGRDNLCPLQLTTSVGMGGRDGAWAELVTVPAASCHPLPPGLDAIAGALVEPYAVALHGVGRSRVVAGRDMAVAVLGAGSVGLMTVAALRAAAVARIAVAEPRPRRAAAAAGLGVQVVEGAGRLAAALGGPPDVVFEATGTTTAPASAVELAAAGGQVVLLGVTAPGEDVRLPGLLWVVKEVDVVPSIAYTSAEFRAAVAAVAGGAVDAIAARADVRPLAEAAVAIQELDRPDGAVKLVLSPTP